MTEASRRAGVAPNTISEIANGTKPGLKRLHALARFFGVPTEMLLRMSGDLPGLARPEDDPTLYELTQEYERLPEEWRPVAVEHLRTLNRLASLPPVRIIGDETENPPPG